MKVFLSLIQCKIKFNTEMSVYFSQFWLCEHSLLLKQETHTSSGHIYLLNKAEKEMRNKDHKCYGNKQLFSSSSCPLWKIIWKTDAIKKGIILHCTQMWTAAWRTSPNGTWFCGPFHCTRGFFSYFFIFIFRGPPRNCSSLWCFPSRNMLPFFSIWVSGLR